MVTIVFLFVCYVSVFIITVLLCVLLLCMLFLICMVLNICNFIQRTEQVPVELNISAIEDYILYIIIIINIMQLWFPVIVLVLALSLRKNGATVSITFSNWQRNGATVDESYFLLSCSMTS